MQVAAYRGDELIVDARIGPASADAVFSVFSVSKAVTALAVHVQAERGHLDPDAPLARYWPEYSTGEVTINQVLSHRAGVPQMPADATPERLCDWDWITARLALAEPLYPPGTVNAYHSMSFGWLLGEVVRRTDPHRRSFARFVGDELCASLGADDFWFGIPPGEQHRVVDLAYPDPPPVPAPEAPVHAAVPPRVALTPDVFNRPEVRRACIPAVGGIANARSVARLFSAFADAGGGPLLSQERMQALSEPRPDYEERDRVYGIPLPVGAGGLWLSAPGLLEGQVLCHPGAGGCIGWAEPETGLAAAICHDRMFGPIKGEHPFAALVDAVRAA